MKYYNIKYC